MKKLVFLLLCALALHARASLPGPTGFAFAKGAKFTVAGYAGSTPLAGFPVLVRVSTNSPAGFSYADLQYPATGADLCFVDMDGTGLPFEIDTWNASGESLIWVRLPSMTNGAEFVMCWGRGTNGKSVCGESPFSGYVGVWHMSETSGTVADSSGNGFAATPSGTAATANSVAVAGPVGNGRQCSTNLTPACLSYLSVPSYDSKSVGDTFAVSGWVSIGSGQTGNNNDARLFSRKEDYQNTHGWEVLWKTSKEIRVRGAASSDNIKITNMDYAGKGWKHVFIVYNGKDSVFYENGVSKGSKTNGTAATENGRPLGIGGYANDNGQQLVGSVDECRLLDAVPSADWAKAEYDSMADATFLTAGEAESYGELVDLSASVSATSVAYTNATVMSSILCLGTGATSADVLVQLAATADFAAPLWSTNYSVSAAGVTNFPVAGLATNATYWVRAFATNDLPESASAGPVSFTTLAPGAPAGTAAFASAGFTTLSATCTPSSLGTGAQSAAIWLDASTNGVVAASASAPAAAGTAAALSVTGLDPATTYQLRVRIVNDWGLETVLPLGEASTYDVPLDGSGPTWSFSANGQTIDFFFDVTEVFDGVACTATLLYDGRTIDPTNFTAAGTLSWAGVTAAATPVPASVVVEAVVDGRTYSRTWTTPRPVSPNGAELFVDSLAAAGGTGFRIDSPVRTIPEALALAEAGATIWVRGGDGRAYGVTNNADTLPIPATLEGLSIRAYAASPGDGGRALVAISDTYIEDGNRAHIVSNRAANVTVSGLDFSFGTTSVGKQSANASCSVFWTAAPFTTMENCLLRMPQPTGYAGSGAASPLVICASKDATNFVMRACEFRNTRCWSAGHGYSPIKVKSNALIACNVFSNVNATVTGQQADLVYGKDTACYDLTFVSNVVYGANDGGNLSSGLLFGLYPGPKSAEIAFNRFVADPGARAQNGGAITHRVNITFGAQFAEAFSGKEATLVHHNTIIGGQSAFLFNEAQGNKRKNQFFSNLILLDPGGTNLVENVKSGTTEFSGGRTTSFIAPSCLRNNAYTGVLTGGNATALATYDLSAGMEIADNVALAVPPAFVCTNDIYHADFYRYRTSRTAAVDLGVLGWDVSPREYPIWIGALPPLYPAATMLIIR